jgi:hypothetical protein
MCDGGCAVGAGHGEADAVLGDVNACASQGDCERGQDAVPAPGKDERVHT